MNRHVFEQLRASKEKSIKSVIKLKVTPRSSSTYEARNILIDNPSGYTAFMTIRYNKDTEAKTINVSIDGIGPICRLDVDAQEHRPVGRNHKHDLKTSGCPNKNIPHAVARTGLSGKTIEEIFEIFCGEALIDHCGIEVV